MTSNYRVGIGIYEVTDPAIGLQMQGFADDSQKTTGVESPLFSRAFIVEDQTTGMRVVIVSADIWARTNVVKQAVVNRLQLQFGTLIYTSDNVLISGTHTHSAPGGYAGYRLYDLTGKGFDPNMGMRPYSTFPETSPALALAKAATNVSVAPGIICMLI
jgi:neutral ceramidase